MPGREAARCPSCYIGCLVCIYVSSQPGALLLQADEEAYLKMQQEYLLFKRREGEKEQKMRECAPCST